MSSPEGRKSLTGNNSQRIYTLGTVGFAIYLLTFSSFGIRTANALVSFIIPYKKTYLIKFIKIIINKSNVIALIRQIMTSYISFYIAKIFFSGIIGERLSMMTFI